MATITPKLTITANSNTASTPGPMSVALSLSTTLGLTVDKTQAKTHTFASATDHFTIIDSDTEDNGSEEAGINGAFVYVKNISATDLDVFIGNVHDAAAEDLAANADQTRLFTLRQNEFAFFPWDYTTDLITDAASGAIIEYFVFNRSNT